MIVYLYYLRLRIQANWWQFLKSTNSLDVLPGEPVTGDKFCRIALVVASAVANACEWIYVMFWMVIDESVLQIKQNGMSLILLTMSKILALAVMKTILPRMPGLLSFLLIQNLEMWTKPVPFWINTVI